MSVFSLIFQALLFALVAVALLILLVLLFRLISPYLAPQNKGKKHSYDSQYDRQRFTSAARICHQTYGETQLVQTDDRDLVVPVETVQGVKKQNDGKISVHVNLEEGGSRSLYRLCNTYANNSIWLLRSESRTPLFVDWVIAFRGTKVIDELISDMMLSLAVAKDEKALLDKAVDAVVQMLVDEAFPRFNISKQCGILITGHSLGGALAESLFLHLRAKGFRLTSAIVFDTPGLPESYRKHMKKQTYSTYRHENPAVAHDAEGLDFNPYNDFTIIYGNDNMVNNLTAAPRGATCYRAGKVDRASLSNVFSFFKGLVSVPAALYSIFVAPLDSHQIQKIADFAESGHYHHDIYTGSHEISGWILRSFFSFFKGKQLDRVQESSFPIDKLSADFNVKFERQERPKIDHPFPGVTKAVDEFVQRNPSWKSTTSITPIPYVIPKPETLVGQFDRTHDFICPFVGITSAGKTSLIKAILDVNPNESNKLRVLATMDTTQHAMIMLWRIQVNENGEETRQWIMDLPGVHGNASDDSSSFGTIPTLLGHMREFVQAACFVIADNPTHEMIRLLREICEAVEDRMFIVLNVKSMIRGTPDEYNSLQSECFHKVKREFRTRYPDESVNVPPVVATKVVRFKGCEDSDREKEYGVDKVTAKLASWLKSKEKEINKGREKALEKDCARDNGTDSAAVGLTTGLGGGLSVVCSIGIAASELAVGGTMVAAATAAAPFLAVGVGATAVAAFATKGVRMFLRWNKQKKKEQANERTPLQEDTP